MIADTDNMLSVLDGYMQEGPDTVATRIAQDFRHRRVEKGLTREQVAGQSGVAVSNIVRFEQTGLVSLKNLIGMATAYDLTLCTEGYNGEHATSVNGTGHPSLQDMIAVGGEKQA